MTATLADPRVTLAASVRLLAVERNVVRLRWGIWNFQEVVVDVRPESPAVQHALGEFFAGLACGGAAGVAFDEYPDLLPVERANLQLVVTELRQTGFLAYDRASERGTDMARTLLGNLDLYNSADPINAGVAFASDSSTAVAYVAGQAAMLGTKVELLSPDFMRDLHRADLTSGMGGLTAADTLTELATQVRDCDSIVVCISQASILTLRNLNRLAMSLQKPLVVGLIDGPFATIVGADSPRTGCLECFEQRSLARLEDHVSYHAFVGAGSPIADGVGNRANGIESMLCAFLLNEAILLRSLGTSRFLGRALSIYLPTYEMQAQDVLRIATCPACGHSSRDVAQEINFSSRVVIDQHVRQALGVTR